MASPLTEEKIILLIDDKPDEVRWDDSTDDLQQIVQNICVEASKHNSFSFRCETATNKADALSLLDKFTPSSLDNPNNPVGCILLDVHFEQKENTGGQAPDSGQDIAKTLEEQYPSIPIIVLTHLHDKGTKRGMGFRTNTYFFQDKNEISKDRKRLTKILFALATDKNNLLWKIEYHHKNHISEFTIRHAVYAPKGISVPVTNAFGSDMAKLLSSPLGEPCDVSDVSKFKSSINSNIRTSTKWHTWGILDRVNCSSGQVCLQVGKVINRNVEAPDFNYSEQKNTTITSLEHKIALLTARVEKLETLIDTSHTNS